MDPTNLPNMSQRQATALAAALQEHGITAEATNLYHGSQLILDTWYVIATIGTTGHGVEWYIMWAEDS